MKSRILHTEKLTRKRLENLFFTIRVDKLKSHLQDITDGDLI
jgi:hypothetical protein